MGSHRRRPLWISAFRGVSRDIHLDFKISRVKVELGIARAGALPPPRGHLLGRSRARRVAPRGNLRASQVEKQGQQFEEIQRSLRATLRSLRKEFIPVL